MQAICVVPIKVRRQGNSVVEVLGTIHLERRDKRPLSPGEIASCEILANQLAVAFDQARRLSMLEQSLRVLDEEFSIVSPVGRVVFRNHAGENALAEPSGWSFPISTVAVGIRDGNFQSEVIADAAKLGTGVHRYVKEKRRKNPESVRVLGAWDEYAAPIVDFRSRLSGVFKADGTVGYVRLTHSITDLVQMHEALHDWLGASNPRETADRILRYFRSRGFKWCRIYLLKNRENRAKRQLESFAQFGIKDLGSAKSFHDGEFQIHSGEKGQQALFLMEKLPSLTVFRFDPDIVGDPVLDEGLGRGIPVYRTRDNWREEFDKTDDFWIEAPLMVGDEVIGLIALSLPPLESAKPMVSPEVYEKLRWCVVSVAVALHDSLHAEQRISRQREEAWRAASQLAIHQLSNKLGAIESLTHLARQWLLTRESFDSQDRQKMSVLLESAQKGIESSRAILKDFRRYASDDPFNDIREFAVADLLRNVERQLRGIHPDVEVCVEEPSPQLRVVASESAMLEVFEILFHNSVAHSTREPRELRVSVRASPVVATAQTSTDIPQQCHLIYEDNGVGIREADREKIFQPFYTTHDQGDGLGLPIARGFMARQEGTISVEKHPGAGARFVICLPTSGQAHSGSTNQ